MKKKIIKFLSFVALSFCLLTGCGSFVEDESLVIASINTELLDDGRTRVTITYTDDELAPSIFYLPKGEQGEQGIQGEGIKAVEQVTDPKSGDVTVTITFTNKDVEPITYTMKNGVSITETNSRYDEETGITYIWVEYSNGEKSDEIPIPPGKDGTASILTNYGTLPGKDPNTGKDCKILVLEFSTGEVITVPIEQGEQGEPGTRIVGVISGEEVVDGVEKYWIQFQYSDETSSEKVYFNKPQEPNQWLYGEDNPPSNKKGKDGDFYYNTETKDIYHKEDGFWVLIVDFEDTTDIVVTFDVNATDAYLDPIHGYSERYNIPKGSNFASEGKQVPIPTRPNYKFIGWYSTDGTLTATHGAFNDFTTVTKDITLYAHYIEE